MARPKKQTVDYFPHDVHHGKTIAGLERRFGNNGYAFWFKLLEMLGDSDGHVLDCRNTVEFEFLQTKTLLDEVSVVEILDWLAKVGSIDQKLWSGRVIWSRNFVDRISDVYKNRKMNIPPKPSMEELGFYDQKPASDELSVVETTPEVSYQSYPTNENPQSKVKESKVNESKVNESIPDDDNFIKFYLNNVEPAASGYAIERLSAFEGDGFEPSAIKLAIEKALENNAKNLNYITKILVSWRDKGLFTRESILAAEKIRQANIKTSRQKAEEPEDYYKNVPRI